MKIYVFAIFTLCLVGFGLDVEGNRALIENQNEANEIQQDLHWLFPQPGATPAAAKPAPALHPAVGLYIKLLCTFVPKHPLCAVAVPPKTVPAGTTGGAGDKGPLA